MLFCFDIDGSLTDWPEELGAVMRALQKDGHKVEVLSGHLGTVVTEATIERKKKLLSSLGVGDAYSRLVVFASPDNHVAEQKVNYMEQNNASALFDNNRQNVKAARKAGFLSLRVGSKK